MKTYLTLIVLCLLTTGCNSSWLPASKGEVADVQASIDAQINKVATKGSKDAAKITTLSTGKIDKSRLPEDVVYQGQVVNQFLSELKTTTNQAALKTKLQELYPDFGKLTADDQKAVADRWLIRFVEDPASQEKLNGIITTAVNKKWDPATVKKVVEAADELKSFDKEAFKKVQQALILLEDTKSKAQTMLTQLKSGYLDSKTVDEFKELNRKLGQAEGFKQAGSNFVTKYDFERFKTEYGKYQEFLKTRHEDVLCSLQSFGKKLDEVKSYVDDLKTETERRYKVTTQANGCQEIVDLQSGIEFRYISASNLEVRCGQWTGSQVFVTWRPVTQNQFQQYNYSVGRNQWVSLPPNFPCRR